MPTKLLEAVLVTFVEENLLDRGVVDVERGGQVRVHALHEPSHEFRASARSRSDVAGSTFALDKTNGEFSPTPGAATLADHCVPDLVAGPVERLSRAGARSARRGAQRRGA